MSYKKSNLENTLKNARISRQNVWFISHIFPTAGESTNEYNSIIKRKLLNLNFSPKRVPFHLENAPHRAYY